MSLLCFFFFFNWNKGLWDLMILIWYCHHTEVTIIWHLGTEILVYQILCQIMSTLNLLKIWRDINVCSIKKVCTNIPYFPAICKSAILFQRQFCGWGFWLVFIWHKDDIMCFVIGEVCWALAVLFVVQLCFATTAEDRSANTKKKEQEREKLWLVKKTRWLSNYLSNKFRIY